MLSAHILVEDFSVSARTLRGKLNLKNTKEIVDKMSEGFKAERATPTTLFSKRHLMTQFPGSQRSLTPSNDMHKKAHNFTEETLRGKKH